MVTTLQQAFHPLVLTFRVLGLTHTSDKFRCYLTIFYNITLWIAYCYFFYYVVFGFKVEKWFMSTFTLINLGMNLLTIIISSTSTSYHYKRMRIFLKRLATVDDTLEELDTPKKYRKLHIYVKRILIVWLVCSQTINISDSIWWFCTTKDFWCIIIPYVTNHYLHVNMLVDLLFITLLWYIGTRFDELNKNIKCLLFGEEYDVRRSRRKATRPIHQYNMCINNYKRVLWITMHLHLELCQIARELNSMFKMQITVEMITYFACLIRLLRYIFLYVVKGINVSSFPINAIYVCSWMSLYVARLFCVNYVCESVSAKSNKINAIIHRLTDLRYADIRDEIYQFTSQIIHHPLKFTGVGHFYLGNDFLRKFFMTVVTYVIIIIQMTKISKASIIY